MRVPSGYLVFSKLITLSYLEIIAVSSADVDDVRDVLNYYKQFDSPLEQFKERQRILLSQLEEQKLQEQNSSVAPVKKWTPTFFGRK